MRRDRARARTSPGRGARAAGVLLRVCGDTSRAAKSCRHRAGEYEALAKKLGDPTWKPDAGPATFNARLGATVVGAREFLIAYNVNLNTREQKLANEVALNIREAAPETRRQRRGRQGRRGPGLARCGSSQGGESHRLVHRAVPASAGVGEPPELPHDAAARGVRDGARGSGETRSGRDRLRAGRAHAARAAVQAGRHYLQRQGRSTGLPERELVEVAIQSLGLAQLSPFDPDKRIIEYAVRVPGPLASMTVERLVDEVSSNSPAPGGGSAAALAGSLGAALTAMVANLTVGRRDTSRPGLHPHRWRSAPRR